MRYYPHKLLYSASFLLILHSRAARAQHYDLRLLHGYDASANLAPLYDSLLLPLLITGDKVYILRTECFPRNAGEVANDRAGDAGSNNRQNDGNGNNRDRDNAANNRAAGGNSNNRDDAGGDNARAGDGGTNDRASGEGANDRAGSGGTNNRAAGGGATGIFCQLDEKGILTISFEHMPLDKSAQLYFNHKYYNAHSKRFKLKKS